VPKQATKKQSHKLLIDFPATNRYFSENTSVFLLIIPPLTNTGVFLTSDASVSTINGDKISSQVLLDFFVCALIDFYR